MCEQNNTQTDFAYGESDCSEEIKNTENNEIAEKTSEIPAETPTEMFAEAAPEEPAEIVPEEIAEIAPEEFAELSEAMPENVMPADDSEPLEIESEEALNSEGESVPFTDNSFTPYPAFPDCPPVGYGYKPRPFAEPSGYQPENGNQPPKKKKKEKDPLRRRFVAFAAVMLAVCMLVSICSGVISSFAVLSLYGGKAVSETTTENLFVPDIAQTQTSQEPASQNATQAVTQSADTTSQTNVPSVSEQSSAVTEAPVQTTAGKVQKTKGEIYADAVNSIVCVTATGTQYYSGFFGQTYSQKVTSSGSGFFVTADGYIVTNYHVIEDAESVKISTYDGKEYDAVITGYEASNDVAVLKTKGTFPEVLIGDSDSLAVGDDVLVIGNALGELSYTFTDGVVSYLNRQIATDSGATIRMFQTNAAINEGNSGGPVYNMDGEVVGIASAKYASESIEGLGFCIPINDVLNIVNDIVEYGYVTGKPSMGVSVQAITTAMSYRYNLPTGCFVAAVGEGTAAQKAGIQVNDVIVQVAGSNTASTDALSNILSQKKAGDAVTVKLYRSGSYKEVSLTLDEYKPQEARTDYSNVVDF